MALPAIRHVASSSKSALGRIHIQCHVKPGASKQREGIVSVTDTVIEICVKARAREGEANKAVTEVFSNILKVPKSNVEIIWGFKSRDKMIAIAGIDSNNGDFISRIREQLQSAIK